MALITRYVDPDATGAGDGTSWTDAYTSMNTWESSEQTNLVTDGDSHLLLCRASSGTADTVTVNITGWTTDSTHYITVQSESGDETIKTGWDATRYRLNTSGSGVPTLLLGETCFIIGIQIIHSIDSSTNSNAIAITLLSSSNTTDIKNCRLEGGRYTVRNNSSVAGVVTLENNIITDSGVGGYVSISGSSIQNINNNIVRNCITYGFFKVSSTTFTVTNCAVFDNGDDFNGTITIDHCASDDGDGTNPVAPFGSDWDNEYNDPTNGDFTLLNGGNCYHGGTDVSLATDIEGDSYHATTPSIGVDEFVGVPTGNPWYYYAQMKGVL